MPYPGKLDAIIAIFESLSEEERRENLVSFALGAEKWRPSKDEQFHLQDVRKDEQCIDTVGVFLRIEGRRARFKILLGPKVQTLTRAMTTILCRGLDNCDVEEILELPEDFIIKIVGSPLVLARSQSIYYMLSRMKNALQGYRDGQHIT
jgi:cysteine desulfuration protein SufE